MIPPRSAEGFLVAFSFSELLIPAGSPMTVSEAGWAAFVWPLGEGALSSV